MSTLTAINSAWSNRPPDTCYDSIADAATVAEQYAKMAVEKANVQPSTLRLEADNDQVVLVGKGNVPANLNHWSFGQLCNTVGAPASYLRKIPATLAVQNLNHGLKERYGTATEPKSNERVNMLVHVNGGMTVRSINSEMYSRIWNYELLKRCAILTQWGWHNPAPFNQGDKVGTCWVSDHDMVLFQVYDDNLVTVPGPNGSQRQLRRGYIMTNSEVGAAKWKTTTFLFDYMCCNRLIWGAENITEIAVRHIGNASDRMHYQFENFAVSVCKYARSSGNAEEQRIYKARMAEIAPTKEAVIEKVFKALRGELSKTAITAGYELAVKQPDTDVPPTHVWALANGLTRYAQTIQYADERVAVERGAGKLVEMAF